MTAIHFFSNRFVKYFIGLFILVTTSQMTWAQEKQKVFLTDLILSALVDKRDTVFSNLEISMENINAKDNNFQVILNQDTLESEWNYLPLGDWLKTKHADKIKIINGNVVVPNKIEFQNCDFVDEVHFIELHFKKDLSFYRCLVKHNFVAFKSKFQNLTFQENQLNHLIIEENYFEKKIEFSYDNFSGDFVFKQNSLQTNFTLVPNSFEKNLDITDNVFLEYQDTTKLIPLQNDSLFYKRSWKIWERLYIIIPNSSVKLMFINNSSNSLNRGDYYSLFVNFEHLWLNNNNIKGALNLGGSADNFYFLRNEISYISLHDFSFSEQNNKVVWDDFEKSKLIAIANLDYTNIENNGFEEIDFISVGISDSASMKFFAENQSGSLPTFYFGENDIEMSDKTGYKHLFRSYYRLHAAFKAEGDIESTNACYMEMKDLETRRLRYVYSDVGGFDNFFRWQLNALLKSYTDYGTNPAKAVRISFYIIFMFGIFYFFFPSEWDKESKKNMLLDFQKFTRKNDHGYVKPFFNLCFGILLSLVNGMMLSLNAFVTLGFGKIPTKGFPRYVCIIQGFIGWFLLSIFTVALINQVLF